MTGFDETIQMSKVLDISLVRHFAMAHRAACNKWGAFRKSLVGFG